MNTQNTTPQPNLASGQAQGQMRPMTDTGSEIDLQTIVNIFLGKWYVFVISVVLALCVAAMYIWHTPKQYVQNATVLVKDKKTGGDAGMAAAFSDLSGLMGMSQSSVQNEIQILTSRTVMRSVIKRLGLQYSYYEPRFMRQDELYVESPIYVIPSDPDAPIKSCAFDVNFLLPSDSLHFEYMSEDTTFICPFNREVELPDLGLVTVQLRKYAADSYFETHRDKVRVVAIELEKATTAFLAAMTCDLAKKDAAIVNMTCQASSPLKASEILNTQIEEYNRLTIESKNEVLDASMNFIGQRLDVVGVELSEVDAKLEGMKSKEKTMNPVNEASALLALTSSQEVQMSDLEIQLRLIKDLRNTLQKKEFQMLPLNVGISSQVLNRQIETYDEGLLRYNQLKTYSSDKSPVVLDKAAELEVLLENIRLTAADVQSSIEMQLKEVQKLSNKNLNRVSEATQNVRVLTSIEREQVVKSELYNYLLQKSEENAIMKSMTESNVRVIDSAWGDIKPIAPKKGRILLIAFALGLALPFAFFYLKDMLYTKVRGRGDIVNVVKAPIVGEIPSKPKKELKKVAYVEPGSNNQISEAFRNMRANLSFLSVDKEMHVIAMASSMPSEGKSFVSLNLSLVYAITGKKVVIIDCDLRKMATSRNFKMRGKKGLSEYLAGAETDVLSLVCPSDYENLFVLPGGVIPPNPAELLMSERFDQAIAKLREAYDYIILDCPPVDVVADTAIANRVADVTLYVIRAGKIDRRQLTNIQEVYTQGRLNNMAIVINDVDYDALNYSMGYSGYGKYYGYRYYGNRYYNYYASYDEGETRHKHSYGLSRKRNKNK